MRKKKVILNLFEDSMISETSQSSAVMLRFRNSFIFVPSLCKTNKILCICIFDILKMWKKNQAIFYLKTMSNFYRFVGDLQEAISKF